MSNLLKKQASPFLQKWKEFLRQKVTVSGYQPRFHPEGKTKLFFHLFGLPLIPLLIAVVYGCFCAYNLSLQKELVQDGTLKLARSLFEEKKYQQFLGQYPQTKAFSLNPYFSDFIPLQNVRGELDKLPLNTPWFAEKEKLIKKKLKFQEKMVVVLGPYQWTEQKLEKPVLVDFSDIGNFLSKIEDEGYKTRVETGAGELFFTEFSFKKKDTNLGQFYLLEACVAEKRGRV